MAKNKPSLADLLRNHINANLAKNYDYSLATNRKQDILNFIQLNKDKLKKDQQNLNTLRPSHVTALDMCLKNKGIDPASLGRTKRIPKFTGDMKPTITPEPQAGIVDPTKKPPVQVTPEGQVIVQTQPPIFDEKSVASTLNAIFLMFRFTYPDLEFFSVAQTSIFGIILNFKQAIE